MPAHAACARTCGGLRKSEWRVSPSVEQGAVALSRVAVTGKEADAREYDPANGAAAVAGAMAAWLETALPEPRATGLAAAVVAEAAAVVVAVAVEKAVAANLPSWVPKSSFVGKVPAP